MNRIVKRIFMVVLAVILLLVITLGALFAYSKTYAPEPQAASIENTTGLVQASGKSLYAPDGTALRLRGINAGQILLQEGWMSPFALEPKKNADGSYVRDADGNIQYPEFTEEEFRAGLKSNPNLAGQDLDDLMAHYWSCFFTEEDFRIIKEELGFNTVRLPFYYLNILHEDLTRKDEAEAFAYLDWFVEQASEQKLYVVLDLHGAPGSQNGFEHSGVKERVAGLWTSEENVAATVDLWDYISDHYTNTAPDLGRWIAAYDILNEPTYEFNTITTEECWTVFNQIYAAIRENGDAHVVAMEGCWDFGKLPDPAEFGWENVMYEYHWYNWWSNFLPYDLLHMYYDAFNIGRDYDVPVYIGEFTCFEDRDAWAKELALFEKRGYHWTIWNYKTTVTGWWTSSWGVYTCQLNLDPATDAVKCNVSTCTLDEFYAACEAVRTENCATGTLYEILTNP